MSAAFLVAKIDVLRKSALEGEKTIETITTGETFVAYPQKTTFRRKRIYRNKNEVFPSCAG